MAIRKNDNTKRQNFNVDADQELTLETSRAYLNAPTIKDAVLRAAGLVNSIGKELRSGKRLIAIDDNGNTVRIVIPEMESDDQTWTYLCLRPHSWRKQLSVKGHKVLASTLYIDSIANNLTPEEVAEDYDIPLAAVREAIRYSQANLDLINMEADEEKS
ncbi:MAG: hypothetical protein WCG75_01765, partial [Armatimonadota bacterium]